MEMEELCVPCNGVHARDQEAAAEEIVKRRRLNFKQQEEIPRPSDISSGSGDQYGPARSWKDLFKLGEKLHPRVGTIMVEPRDELFLGVQLLVDELVALKYRLTVILNQESRIVEVLGNPEKWQELPKCQQIRKAKPARISIAVFGADQGKSPNITSLGKNLGEGDRHARIEGHEDQPSVDIMMPDASAGEAVEPTSPDVEPEKIISSQKLTRISMWELWDIPPRMYHDMGPSFCLCVRRIGIGSKRSITEWDIQIRVDLLSF